MADPANPDAANPDAPMGDAQSAALRALRARLQLTLQGRVEAVSDETPEEEFVTLLGALGALRQVAQRLGALGPGASADAERRVLLQALHTLNDELAR